MMMVMMMLMMCVYRHVFLGFSRDGQFVLSYTMQVEVNNVVPVAGNSYRLQCWLFTPYRPLRLVRRCLCHVIQMSFRVECFCVWCTCHYGCDVGLCVCHYGCSVDLYMPLPVLSCVVGPCGSWEPDGIKDGLNQALVSLSLVLCVLVVFNHCWLGFSRAMLCNRGLCCHAVSVRLCVCLLRPWILSKRINISSTFFHHLVAKPF